MIEIAKSFQTWPIFIKWWVIKNTKFWALASLWYAIRSQNWAKKWSDFDETWYLQLTYLKSKSHQISLKSDHFLAQFWLRIAYQREANAQNVHREVNIRWLYLCIYNVINVSWSFMVLSRAVAHDIGVAFTLTAIRLARELSRGHMR